MNSKLLIAFCALLCAIAAIDCKPKIVSSDGKTYYYDLHRLSHPAGEKDSLSIRDDEGDYIYVNICGPSSEKCSPSGSSAVCMRTADYTYVSLGKVESQEFTESVDVKPGGGLQVTYSNGDDCDFGNYQTVITLICDQTQDGTISEVDEGECWYKMNILSKYACGQENKPDDSDASGGGGGEVAATVILIILLCGIVVYFAVGAVCQKKKNDASSFREYVIHNEFWFSLPFLVKDGVLFIFHGFKKGDYVSV